MPVEFAIKEREAQNKLYLAVTMTKIKETDITVVPAESSVGDTTNQSLNVNVAQLIKFVNSSEGDFFKYIPDELLNEQQMASKRVAKAEEEKKVETLKSGSRQYSLSEKTMQEIANGNNNVYGNDVTRKQNNTTVMPTETPAVERCTIFSGSFNPNI